MAGVCDEHEQARSKLFDLAVDLLCVADHRGHFVLLNPAWERVLGWTRAELRERPFIEFVHPDDRESTRKAVGELRSGLTLTQFENRYRRRDGSYARLAWTAYPGDGETYAVARDVTAEREAVEQLELSRDDYRMIFEGMLDGFSNHEMIFDDNGDPADYRFLAVNPAFEEQTGLKAEDVVGKRVLEVLPRTERHWIESFGKVAKTGAAIRFENYSREFGKYFECLAFQPKPGQFACTFHDITARKKAEEERAALQQQMQRAQKLESLGMLAGGIAHDFNNILSAVLGCSDLARDQLPVEHPVRRELDTITQAGERLGELCRQLLAYAGKSRVTAVAPTDLSELVGQMTSLLELSIPKKIELSTDLAPGLPNVAVDATQIHQILLNLVINAADAIGDAAGHVQIRTGVGRFTRAELADAVGTQGIGDDEYVFVEVKDDGAGMEPRTISRIFEPFFSTKVKGRGLGLAATVGILRGHGGAVVVDSRPGAGSVFRVLLPLSRSDAPPKAIGAAATRRTLSGTVLVADDEDLVRRLLIRCLEGMGLEVIAARDGREAVMLFEANGARIAMAVLDVNMPQLGGAEVAAALEHMHPGLPVLFLSGYGEEALGRCHVDGPHGFLPKPFRMAELEDKVLELFPGS